MSEWFKEHAWKACVGNSTEGSNPSLSASQGLIRFGGCAIGACEPRQVPEGSNGSGSPDVTQYPLGLAQ